MAESFTNFHAVQALTKTPQSLAKIRFLALEISSTVSVQTTKVDTSGEAEFDIARARSPTSAFVGYIIFHTGIRIDVELNWLHQASETGIILSSIIIIRVVLWIINVLFRPVDTKSIVCHLEFFRSITKG